MTKIAERNAHVVWKGTLRQGEGTLGATAGHDHSMVRGALRFQQEHGVPRRGTNPEELLACAHAVCFTQTLAYRLTEEGVESDWIDVTATCTLERREARARNEEGAAFYQRAFGETPVENFAISKMHLKVRTSIPGSDAEGLARAVEIAREVCPVSNALHDSVEITVEVEHGENLPEPPA